jgi:hypothetical protein
MATVTYPIITGVDNSGEKYVRTTRFAIISSGTSGTITIPQASSVVLDDFGGTTDAVVSQVSGGKPNYVSAVTSLGAVVATTFDSNGNWAFTGTPSSYPVAIIYRVQQKLRNFDSTSSDIVGGIDLLSSGTVGGSNTYIQYNDLGTLAGDSSFTFDKTNKLITSPSIYAPGTFGTGWTEPSIGSGTRLLWYPRKSAFRSGYVSGSQWNNSNIGDYSWAGGESCTASGQSSFAFGEQSVASGRFSAAVGYSCASSANSAISGGDQSVARGYSSVSIGYGNVVLSSYGVALGLTNYLVEGSDGSFAGGGGNFSDSSYSALFGSSNSIVGAGDYGGFCYGASNMVTAALSATFGYLNVASGYNSFCFGSGNTSSGAYSSASGDGIQSLSYAEFSVGCYGTSYTPMSSESFYEDDRIFNVGIGQPGAELDAMTILKSGSTGIGTPTPDASSILDVNSTTRGFLPPRMTTSEKNAVASPATGLVLFDTTLAKLCVYTGASWETVTSV